MALETNLPEARKAASKQGWVLVLVREERLRQLLLTILRQAGYALLGCSTLAEAGQVLRQQVAPSLILFDGAEASEETLCDQLQQIVAYLSPGKKCRVIVFSLAHPQPRRQQLPGVDALIARPFDLTQVLDQIETLMRAA